MSQNAHGVFVLSTPPPERDNIRQQICDLLMGAHRLCQSQIVANVPGSPEEILVVLYAMVDDQLVNTRRDPGCEPVYSIHRL